MSCMSYFCDFLASVRVFQLCWLRASNRPLRPPPLSQGSVLGLSLGADCYMIPSDEEEEESTPPYFGDGGTWRLG
jgi:hypothetical protein